MNTENNFLNVKLKERGVTPARISFMLAELFFFSFDNLGSLTDGTKPESAE